MAAPANAATTSIQSEGLVAPAGGWAGQFAGKVDVSGNVDVGGYLKLRVFTAIGEAPAADCDEDREKGRMAVIDTGVFGSKYMLVCFDSWYVMNVP